MNRSNPSRTNPGNPGQAGAGVLSAAVEAMRWLEENRREEQIADWVETVLAHSGRLIVSGMGKSGLVAQKISASLASTGSPSFFLHPAEALHGDLGMIRREDTVLLLSNSGETEEILRLLPSLVRLSIPIASITSNSASSLGRAGRWCFEYRLPVGEGCPIDLAPMASTTLQMVWGDILTASLMLRRGFTAEQFAELHPGGSLGTRLLKIKDLMHSEFPRLGADSSLPATLGAISGGKLGMAVVMDGERLGGVISDGDVRRALERAQQHGTNPLVLKAGDLIGNASPHSIEAHRPAVEAAGIMEARKITFLLVMEDDKPCGVIHIHDLLQAKVI